MSDGNLRGILLVLYSMAIFAVEDALMKHLSAAMPVGQLLIIIGLGGMAAFAALAGPHGRRGLWAALRNRPVFWRTAAEAVSAITFVTALSLIPLSTVAAVFQATPLAVTAGAALFLGETVGWRRWTAVAVGFAGVLMIIRPGLEGFRPEAGLVLITVFSIALRDLVTRAIPASLSSAVVSFHGFLGVVVAGLVLIAAGQRPAMPDGSGMALLVLTLFCATTGYLAIVASMRAAEASALMPFRYARLIFSLAIGVLFFAERPDGLTLCGAALILAAAFYTYLRERARKQVAAAA
ncbi:DMT family transporter [Frigidibacter sp. SD6-1]|uniref:DMT family transporter n=1 Tax=Frigidibacter sp. SD6-1 TaxID=3032581 RepID=UPI0024DF72A7|nr:DMT family transporter [Frigidibacter sp. SD6-1]